MSFELFKAGNEENIEASSHYFNVSVNGAEETTASGLSSGAVAGISVGGTIGGILLLAGLGILLLRRFRNRKERESQQAPAENMDESVQGNPYRISELEAKNKTSELSSEPHARAPGELYEAP